MQLFKDNLSFRKLDTFTKWHLSYYVSGYVPLSLLFSLCGDNEKELPVELTSNENELSLFFRSSLRLHGRGVNCTYQVVEEKTENGLRFNGDEGIENCIMQITRQIDLLRCFFSI